jgi:hypothetical protein
LFVVVAVVAVGVLLSRIASVECGKQAKEYEIALKESLAACSNTIQELQARADSSEKDRLEQQLAEREGLRNELELVRKFLGKDSDGEESEEEEVRACVRACVRVCARGTCACREDPPPPSLPHDF